MDLENIFLISFGYFEKGLPELIAKEVEREYSIPVKINEGYLDLSEFYDPARRQYNGTNLLEQINQGFASENNKVVGLFNVDLFIPILTYIFGQAYLNGHAAIVSIYRLTNERYGLKPDAKILSERFIKEVIHEIGHMYGLIHCNDPVCVMRSGTYVEDIDQKSKHLCNKCRLLINLPV